MSRIEQHADELFNALRGGTTLVPLVDRDPNLTLDDAYGISLAMLARRQQQGERVVGKKIGVTSKVVQDMLGVHQPDFGFLTDPMLVGEVIDIAAHKLIQPRIEAEIAFFLKDDLSGTDITADDVIAATEFIAPCLEIVDSRIENWNISIIDTVADNASCGVFVIGEARVAPQGVDLPGLKVTVTKNGAPLSEGYGRDVQGNPAQAVAWLANTLGRYGVTLNAGDVILSGSMVPLHDAVAGDVFAMNIDGIGGCSARFV